MTYYLKRGSSFKPTTEENLDIHKKLPVGNYLIKQDPVSDQFYFDRVEAFPKSGKVYGKTNERVNRIYNTFCERPNATGVLLVGEKGSGKTLLAKMLSIRATVDDIPTILVNEPFHGDGFNQLIQELDQPAVILFDEFEKTYNTDHQEHILTLFDGVFPSKKLFILTCNNAWRINEHLSNRPGRIYYSIAFKGLNTDFITEYCQDNLRHKEHIAEVCKISALFTEFNFDMLKALVEEMNRYNDSPQEALEMLNATPTDSDGTRYDVQLFSGDVEINNFEPKVNYGNPILQEGISISLTDGNTEQRNLGNTCVPTRNGRANLLGCLEDDCEPVPKKTDAKHIIFRSKDLVSVDPITGVISYASQGYTVRLKKHIEHRFNFNAY
jgi:hypothetical protein